MSHKMRCLQLRDWGGDLVAGSVDVPAVGPTEVLVEVEATGVGLTVVNAMNGELGDDGEDLPLIPGHEIVGTVDAVGDGVTNVTPGDRVTTHFYLHCGHCEACLGSREPLCENLRGHIGVHTDGGFAEYVRLPGINVVRLPDGLDPVDATVIPDAVGTPYHVARERADIQPGEQVMVIGAGGGVGIHLVQIARYFGGEVTAVDLDERKLERCRELGAEHTIDTSRRSVADAVSETGRRYDVVVDFTGADPVVADALGVLAPRARFVNMTTLLDRPLEVAPVDLLRKELSVIGSRYCSKAELTRAAAFVAEGTIEPVISDVVGLDEVPTLLDTIAEGNLIGRGAVVP